LAPALVESAKRQDRNPRHRYLVGDATKPLPLEESRFSHAAVVLALQNMDPGSAAVANAARHLRPGGRLAIVLNHPCFRIPRQSSWEIDPRNKLQFRRVNRYLAPLKIPIRTNPSAGERSPVTLTFHHPLSDYSRWLAEARMSIELIEEWASDKTSEGKAARMENLSRSEFPLFLTILAVK
jgi:SAM-dependent methyltransferase